MPHGRKVPPPSILAVPLLRYHHRARVQVLTPKEQNAIAAIASIVELRRDTPLYPEGGRASHAYNIVSGMVETYRLLPDGQRRITSFLFPSDIAGLSESGEYVATAQALTPVIAYKIPYDALQELLQRDTALDVAFLCKLSDELRQSERHVLLTSHRGAQSRVAAFLLWLASSEAAEGRNSNHIRIPMLRTDIADYIAIAVESLSRTLSDMEAAGLIKRETPRQVTLLDLKKLEALTLEA